MAVIVVRDSEIFDSEIFDSGLLTSAVVVVVCLCRRRGGVAFNLDRG